MDFYLSPEGQPYLEEIKRLAAQTPSEETDALLLGYAVEGIRMEGAAGLYRKASAVDTIVEADGRKVSVRPGDRIFVSLGGAAKDPKYFPEPDKVNPGRPLDAYIHYGAEPYAWLGRKVNQVALTELFRTIFRKKGLRRAAGPQGLLKKIPQPGGFSAYLTEDWGTVSPFPTSMKVTWDDE